VTEERFVPALNVIANEYNIPSDIAGATLMAAGASSPELFSSFVSLFITHSALGLGTVSFTDSICRWSRLQWILVYQCWGVQTIIDVSPTFSITGLLYSIVAQIVGSEIFNQLIICAG